MATRPMKATSPDAAAPAKAEEQKATKPPEGQDAKRFTDRHPVPLLMASTMATMFLPQVMRRLAADAELPIAAALPSADGLAKMLFDVLLHGIAGPALPSGATVEP